MKVAVSSSSFSVPLRRGDFTHLEWLEACSSRLDADGVVFAHHDLPRRDAEYAAQLKKVAVDLGLVPLALDLPGGLDPDRPDDERAAALALAVALGTALIRVGAGAPGDLPPQTFVRTVAAGKAWCKAAKSANITLLVQPAPGSLIANLADAKHLVKDVDSAWLRYAIGPGALDGEALGPRERVLITALALDEPPPAGEARGWYVLEGAGGDDPFATVGAALDAFRLAQARRRLGIGPLQKHEVR